MCNKKMKRILKFFKNKCLFIYACLRIFDNLDSPFASQATVEGQGQGPEASAQKTTQNKRKHKNLLKQFPRCIKYLHEQSHFLSLSAKCAKPEI